MKIQEIARLAGVSTATVSRVFSHHPSIRPEVREHVFAVARQYGYHPRLDVFRSTTFPLVDYYKSRGILVEIPPELSEKGAVSDMRELAQKLGLIGK